LSLLDFNELIIVLLTVAMMGDDSDTDDVMEMFF
jgi:hypothetical protein